MNKCKLKELKEQRIYINNDMSKVEREIQAVIRKKAKEQKEKGMQVKIGFQKMVVNGVLWRWSKEGNTLEQSKN